MQSTHHHCGMKQKKLEIFVTCHNQCLPECPAAPLEFVLASWQSPLQTFVSFAILKKPFCNPMAVNFSIGVFTPILPGH